MEKGHPHQGEPRSQAEQPAEPGCRAKAFVPEPDRGVSEECPCFLYGQNPFPSQQPPTSTPKPTSEIKPLTVPSPGGAGQLSRIIRSHAPSRNDEAEAFTVVGKCLTGEFFVGRLVGDGEAKRNSQTVRAADAEYPGQEPARSSRSEPVLTPSGLTDAAGESAKAGSRMAAEDALKADDRSRTGDPFITSEVLYQLSYVGAGGAL